MERTMKDLHFGASDRVGGTVIEWIRTATGSDPFGVEQIHSVEVVIGRRGAGELQYRSLTARERTGRAPIGLKRQCGYTLPTP